VRRIATALEALTFGARHHFIFQGEGKRNNLRVALPVHHSVDLDFLDAAAHARRPGLLASVGMTPEQMVEEVRKCVQLRGKAGPEIEAGVSTAFGCTMQGVVRKTTSSASR